MAVAPASRALAAGDSTGSPGPVPPEMVTPETVKAIEKGLNYLAKTQRNDGSWLNNAGGYGVYPAVMTSLAGLAFLSNGSTPQSGRYARNVSKAMNYILNVAESNKADGLIAGPGSESRSMYGHGFAMLFLAQCYGMDVGKETETRIRDCPGQGRRGHGQEPVRQRRRRQARRRMDLHARRRTPTRAPSPLRNCRPCEPAATPASRCPRAPSSGRCITSRYCQNARRRNLLLLRQQGLQPPGHFRGGDRLLLRGGRIRPPRRRQGRPRGRDGREARGLRQEAT